jgi:hypothetical protein
LRKSGELFCDLIVAERKDHIAKIEEDDFYRHLANPNPSQPPFSKGRRKKVPFFKGG